MATYELKVSAFRSKVTHYGNGSSPRDYITECGSGKVSTGSRSASQFLLMPRDTSVNCAKCIKLHAPAIEIPAPVKATAPAPTATPDYADGLEALSLSLGAFVQDFAGVL